LLVKTSLRERWKQFDRDAIVIEQFVKVQKGAMDIWCVFLREHPGDMAVAMIREAAEHEAKFWSSARLRTVLDAGAMRELFIACGAVTTT
jgi:hypothetical protein